MGAAAVRVEAKSKAIKNANGKEIELFVEICDSLGFGGKKDQVLGLIKMLNDKGYDVNYVIEPMKGGNGEYFVYVVCGGNKKIVFSNDKKHGCVLGNKISKQNMTEIITAIEKV